MHAFASCLSDDDICEAVIRTIDGDGQIHRTVKSALVRRAERESFRDIADALSVKVTERFSIRPQVARVESLLSDIYKHLSPPMRLRLLERWQDSGSTAMLKRALRALENDPIHYSDTAILEHWRRTLDARAAKIVAYRAAPSLVAEALPEFVERRIEGWIISRAALRAPSVPEQVWDSIRQHYPATFAYLCAKLGRSLSNEEAISLVWEADPGDFGTRGLAVWAIGNLGMQKSLDELWASFDELERQYREAALYSAG